VLGQVLSPTQLLGMGLVVAASALVLGLGARKDPAESTGA
jgi:inner membrane transporter RhtA